MASTEFAQNTGDPKISDEKSTHAVSENFEEPFYFCFTNEGYFKVVFTDET